MGRKELMTIDLAKSTYAEIHFEPKNAQDPFAEQSLKRLIMYYTLLESKVIHPAAFWDRESRLEIKIFSKLKEWESRHPILGILMGTILGGILISLITGIILEAMY